MNYKDQWATNENGDQFIFTVEMQRKLHEAGLPIEAASLSALPAQATSSKPIKSAERSYQPKPIAKPSPDKKKSSDVEAPASIQIDPQTGKYIGRMKWYNMKKGYGFIMRGADEEMFFHKSSTVGDPTELNEGEWILYDVEETHKGPEATEIESYSGDTSMLI